MDSAFSSASPAARRLGFIREDGVGVRLSNVNGQLLRPGRGKLLPLKPVDGRLRRRRAAGEFLAGFLASARVDHGRQIVGAQVLLNEPLRCVPHGLRTCEGGVQIVQQENVDAAVEGASGCTHIRFDRLGRARGRERSLDREIDQRKRRRRLRLPSSRISKSSFVRFRTNAPVWSVTMAWTSTKLVSALNVTRGDASEAVCGTAGVD